MHVKWDCPCFSFVSLLNCVYLFDYNSLVECVCTVSLHSFDHESVSSFLFRDSVMEILFEQDNEEKSVASLILDALVKVEEKSSLCYVMAWVREICHWLVMNWRWDVHQLSGYNQNRSNRNISVNVLIAIVLQGFSIICREECRVPVFLSIPSNGGIEHTIWLNNVVAMAMLGHGHSREPSVDFCCSMWGSSQLRTASLILICNAADFKAILISNCAVRCSRSIDLRH